MKVLSVQEKKENEKQYKTSTKAKKETKTCGNCFLKKIMRRH